MKMYCRDCGDNVPVKKEKDKDIYAKKVYWKCIECGVIVSEISGNGMLY